jgi:hypothetical protein
MGVYTAIGVVAGVIAGYCLGLAASEFGPSGQTTDSFAILVAAGVIAGAIVGGTGDIANAIKGNLKS